MLTDSANCYSSTISGHPENEDKGVRLQRYFVRGLRDCLSLTFVDQVLKLADIATKTVNGHDLPVRRFLLTCYFRVGFLGRKESKQHIRRSLIQLQIIRIRWGGISYFLLSRCFALGSIGK